MNMGFHSTPQRQQQRPQPRRRARRPAPVAAARIEPAQDLAAHFPLPQPKVVEGMQKSVAKLEHQQQQNTLVIQRLQDANHNHGIESRALHQQIAQLLQKLQKLRTDQEAIHQDLHEHAVWMFATALAESKEGDVEESERVILAQPFLNVADKSMDITVRRVHANGAVTEHVVPFLVDGKMQFSDFSFVQ